MAMERIFLGTLLVFSSILASAWARTVCYEDIGCFDNGPPFYDPIDRPINWLPESREEVGTTFRLNTRNVPDTANYQELSTYDLTTLINSDFSGDRETKIITHGFTQGASVDWMEEMTAEFLSLADYNIIRVDWRRGALGIYGVSAANSRIVGAEISLMIDLLNDAFGVSASSFHIIGHSLGAQAAGYAGETQIRNNTQYVSRITGLDPAGPYFEDTDPIVRLDPTDAVFVDVIHTDTDPIYNFGYGMYAACGHMDFFPNGGRAQPGCDKSFAEFRESEENLWDAITQFVACNHLRSIEYFTESINSECSFLAFQCTRDHDDYNFGNCFNKEVSALMGWKSPDYYPGGTNLVYQVNTQLDTPGDSPNCGYQYLFTLKLDDDDRQAEITMGKLFVTLIGYEAQSSKFALTAETQEYIPGALYIHMGVSDVDPGELSGLYFEWEYDNERNIIDPQIFIHQITVTDVDDNAVTLCGDYEGNKPDTVKEFWPTNTVCPSQ